jgi:hypothetical protein
VRDVAYGSLLRVQPTFLFKLACAEPKSPGRPK